MGHVTLTTSLLGMLWHPGAVFTMINLPTKSEVFLHSLWLHERQYNMWKMGWSEVVRGSLKVTGSRIIRQSAQMFLVAFHSNNVLSCAISETQRNVGPKWPILTYPTSTVCPRWELPHWNFNKISGIKISFPWSIVRHCFRDPMCSHHGTILACERHTDRHMAIAHTVVASWYKNAT